MACVSRVLMLVGGLGFWSSEPQAAKVNVPANTAPVVDGANLFTKPFSENINQRLRALSTRTGIQVGVLTVSSLAGLSIEEYSIEVATAWALGTEKADQGVLMVIAPSERRMRIEVGRGLEGDLTDLQSGRIINQIMTPHFRQGDWEGGTAAGLAAILEAVAPGGQEFPPPVRQEPKSGGPIVGLVFFGFILLYLLTRGLGGGGGPGGPGGRSRRRDSGLADALVLGAIFGSGRPRASGSGWGGGGGWSGGGGSFGGGGASGSW